jgi:hypothetical protein
VRKFPLFLALACVACSKGPQADVPAIGEARSLAAEWALINDQAAHGKLNRTYVDTMRASIREQLQESATSLSQPNSTYGREVQALLRQPDDAPAQELRTHADKLKHIEDSLESA